MSEEEEKALVEKTGLPLLTLRECVRLRNWLAHRPLMLDLEGRIIDEYKGANISAEGGVYKAG